ncbi:hypothetical protein [Longimicrobium sp.]|jgi:hypothetical protein|uniref:hypothetical protein n=1 Tax=Longimicrobium sp. TaxID=2029185 RepID=UPI002ED91321
MTASITLIADIYPASIIDGRTGARPEGVPAKAKIRVILATTEIKVAWAAPGGGVESLTIPLTFEETAEADHNGGTVGTYEIKRAGGCSCDKMLKRWNPYAGQPTAQVVRSTPSSRTESWGLPQKYKRL